MSNDLLVSVHGTDFGTAIAERDISNLIGISGKPNEGIDFDFDIEGKEWPAGMNDYWNSSVRSLFNSIQNLTNNNQAFLNNQVSLDDLKHSDAGLSFESDPYVRPNKNIDAVTYLSVRSIDKVISILKNEVNMQFTRTQNGGTVDRDEWIRLLMPENIRRVYVEDLNRNFWVIGQTLAAVCEYLYGNSIRGIFEGLLKEIVGLWDNTLTLWVILYMLINKTCYDVRVITLPIPSSSIYNETKYDNFGYEDNFISSEVDTQTGIIKRLEYLWKRMPDTYLVIIPYRRKENYKHNYYANQIYPCIITYNPKTESTSFIRLLYQKDGANHNLSFQPYNYRDYIYAAAETDSYYKYTYPLSGVPDTFDESIHNYYGAIRIKIHIKTNLNNENINIQELTFTGYDAIKQSLFGVDDDNDMLIKYTYSPSTSSDSIYQFNVEVGEFDTPTSYGYTFDIIPEYGYYLGEIPSYSYYNYNTPTFNFVKENSLETKSDLIKIANFLPTNFNNNAYLGDQTTTPFKIQENPNHQNTAYEINITTKSGTQNLYPNGTGSSNKCTRSQCDFFSPLSEDGALSVSGGQIQPVYYWAGHQQQELISQGLNVISAYIKTLSTEERDYITYFMAAIGIFPWHNGAVQSGISQGYWSVNLLTHIYRFIPQRLSEFITNVPTNHYRDIVINGEVVGRLIMMGQIDKQEFAYTVDGDDVFSDDPGTTWRLAEVRPAYDTKYDTYVEIKETHQNISYYVDVGPNGDADIRNAYNNDSTPNHSDFCAYLSQNYQAKKQYLESSLDISSEISSFDGLWCTYDGNITNNSGNTHIYKLNNNVREVGYTYFTFDSNSHLILPTAAQSKAFARKEGISAFSAINGNNILVDDTLDPQWVDY